MKKNQRFCFRDPRFPETTKAGLMFLYDLKQGHTTALIPFPSLDPLKDNFVAWAKEMNEYFRKKHKSVIGIVVLELKLNRLWKLKKEYWQNPSVDTIFQYATSFIKVMKVPKLYQILAVANLDDGKHWHYRIAMPFYLTGADETIEKFLCCSKTPVEISAKYAALYTIEKAYGVDITTGEVVDRGKPLVPDPQEVN